MTIIAVICVCFAAFIAPKAFAKLGSTGQRLLAAFVFVLSLISFVVTSYKADMSPYLVLGALLLALFFGGMPGVIQKRRMT
ncbi:hypothetical protein [Corynebacterium gerontici]|nr:hypothetical protein [Corynebacterium gerontici]